MGPDNVTTTQKYDGIIVQSSLLGVSIPKMWGTNKVGCNLMDYLDFSSQKVSSGKGGANPQYTYKATLLLGIVQGPIAGIRTIYKDQAIFTATASGSKEVNGTTVTISSKTPDQAAGLNGGIFTGAIGQTPWTYLDTDSPTHAIGYSGIAYAAAYHYPLDTSATPPNHNFEVQATIRATIGGVVNDDANPADIVNDMLPDVPRWPANAISDLTTYSTYCLAQGLLLSPIADNGRQASDLLTEILTCSNSDAVWSDGQLKIVPYGDTTITGNGATYTPDLTPIYALTWDDIIPNSAGEDPIQWDLTRTLEAYNYVQVNFLDRTLQYATNTATAVDQANINEYGRRQQSPQEFDSVCLMATASTIAQLMVQRSANVRRTAQFTVSELFGLLDPMDLITVPLRDGGNRLVRIVEANEQQDGSIQLQVEEMLVGAAHAAEYTRQDGLGVASDFNVDPGDTYAPAIINPPLSLTNGANEVWIAASGGPNWGGCVVWASFDGDTYQSVGTITSPGRYGVTTTDFPASSDPDTTQTLGVNLTESGGTLTAGTQADADGQATLCAVGTEIIAYSAATLTAPNAYSLGTYIRRGLEGTTIADQPAGSLFVRLDGSQVAIPYNQGQIGKTVYVKLQSFNLYGGAYEDLDLCEAYEFTAEPNGTDVEDVTWTAITGIPTLLTSYVSSGGVAVSTANVPASATFGDGATAASTALAAINAATNEIGNLTSEVSGLYTVTDTQTETLSASVGMGTMVQNPVFAIWSDQTPGEPPDDWQIYGTFEVCQPTTGRNSLYGAFLASDGVNQSGLQQYYAENSGLTNVGAGWFVLEADIYVPEGPVSLAGAGLLAYSPSETGVVVNFASDPDINGVVWSGEVAGGTSISWRKLVQISPITNGELLFYAMADWGGFATDRTARSLYWYRADIRVASEAEVAGSQALTTANSTYSSYTNFVSVQDGANESYAGQLYTLNAAVFEGEAGTLQAQITSNEAAQASQNGTFATEISNVTATVGTLTASVTNNTAAIATLTGQTAFYLESVSTSGGTASLELVSTSGGFTAIQLLASNVLFGPDAEFNETYNVLIFDNGTVQNVIGCNFGASSNLLQWFGPASVSVPDMTTTNGYWAFAADGTVYYGSSSLGSSIPQTKSNETSSANSSTALSATFTNVAAGSIWQSANMSMRPNGVTDPFPGSATSASGTWTLEETGSSGTFELASGTWTWSDYVSGEGVQSAVVNNPTQISGVALSNTGTVNLTVQLAATSGSLNGNTKLSVFGQIVAGS